MCGLEAWGMMDKEGTECRVVGACERDMGWVL